MYDPIIVTTTTGHSPERVWAALTKPAEMRRWFFEDLPDFKAEKGFKTEFPVQAPSGVFVHQWEVMEVHPGKNLTVKWRFKGYAGESLVTYTVEEKDGASHISVRAAVTRPFPEDVPEFRRESGVAGWEHFIGRALPQYLDG